MEEVFFTLEIFLVSRLRDEAENHEQSVLRKSSLFQNDIEQCRKTCEGLIKGSFRSNPGRSFNYIFDYYKSHFLIFYNIEWRKEINILVSNTEALKGEISIEENNLAKEKRFVHWKFFKHAGHSVLLTLKKDFLGFCSDYEIYQKKIIRHKELSELAETFNAVNVEITRQRKYYKMLNNESTCKNKS